MQMQEKLAQRRRELMARCAEQRNSMHLQSERWRQSLSVEDATHTALTRVKQYQPWLIGAAIAVVLIKPRRIAKLLSAATAAAAMLRTAMPIVQQVQRRVWQYQHPGRMQM
jgi:small-conductance mechanosensitive channel